VTDTVLARIAALKLMPIPQLKQQWRDLLASTYQLPRNVLAACVPEDGALAMDRGHALIIYDRRNPTMPGGEGDRPWRGASATLREPAVLRRLSWQDFIGNGRAALNWLKEELGAKYGLCP